MPRDRGRLLSQTDNIALLRAGPFEIVRVGRARLAEEAWWRYGRELTARRERYRRLSLAASVGGAAVLLGGIASGASGLLGMWWFWGRSRDTATSAARWLRFGGTAWLGSGHCAACGDDRDGGLRLSGREGERVLRRVLAHRHHAGASEGEVRSATRLIEEAGSPLKLARLVVRDRRRLGEIQRTGALGFEIAANEHAEQRLLELELAELEATWRHEEELAAIVDGELTSVPLFEQLRRRKAGQR